MTSRGVLSPPAYLIFLHVNGFKVAGGTHRLPARRVHLLVIGWRKNTLVDLFHVQLKSVRSHNLRHALQSMRRHSRCASVLVLNHNLCQMITRHVDRRCLVWRRSCDWCPRCILSGRSRRPTTLRNDRRSRLGRWVFRTRRVQPPDMLEVRVRSRC